MTQHFLYDSMCPQQRLRSACTSMHADQSLCCPPPDYALDPWLLLEFPVKTDVQAKLS